jgi:hypothetical protein
MPKFLVTIAEQAQYELKVNGIGIEDAINIDREKFLKMSSAERDKHCLAIRDRTVCAEQLEIKQPLTNIKLVENRESSCKLHDTDWTTQWLTFPSGKHLGLTHGVYTLFGQREASLICPNVNGPWAIIL